MRASDGSEYLAECFDMPDWVTVVAITPRDEIVLVRQKRYGIDQLTLETPGGIVDRGETPRRAAARELLEETGYRAKRWRSLGWAHPNPAAQNNRLFMMLATDAEQIAEPLVDANEELDVVVLPRALLRARLRRGGICHALSALALERACVGCDEPPRK
jgi:8-oxo-dGTP pyrophosphatase MutT (NUDIX family)